jgi:hypothetical protein
MVAPTASWRDTRLGAPANYVEDPRKIHTWLVLDFFEDARRTGGTGSSLTTTIWWQSSSRSSSPRCSTPTPLVLFAAAISPSVAARRDRRARQP